MSAFLKWAVPLASTAMALFMLTITSVDTPGARAGGLNYKVNSTSDSIGDGICYIGECTFREAILLANEHEGHDLIDFVPGDYQLLPTTPYPAVESAEGITIDGTGASVVIVSLGAAGDGLLFRTPVGVTLRDVIVRNLGIIGFGSFAALKVCPGEFMGVCGYDASGIEITNISAEESQTGIMVRGASLSDVTIQDSLAQNNSVTPIMVDFQNALSGLLLEGNVVIGGPFEGISVNGAEPATAQNIQLTDNTISGGHTYIYSGGEVRDVLVSGNESIGAPIYGLNVASDDSLSDISIVNNTVTSSKGEGIKVAAFGPGISGLLIEGNVIEGSLRTGIQVEGLSGDENNIVMENTVSGSGQDAIRIEDRDDGAIGAKVTISRNRTFSNTQLGIDLYVSDENNPGLTLNDTGDNDTGPNGLLNYPEFSTPSGYEFAFGEACPNCLIEVFVADSDSSGYGEGQQFLFDVRADSNGDFITPFCGLDLLAGAKITATATDPQGNTSEFSANYVLLNNSEPCPTASPSPSPTPSPTPTPTASPSPTAQTTPTPTVPPGDLAWGDHNCSGDVDPVDGLLTLRFDAGLSADTGECPGFGEAVPGGGPGLAWGDVDCDRTISAIDGLKLLRHDAGLSVGQEAGCPEIGDSVG
jgi:hypothetical protein